MSEKVVLEMTRDTARIVTAACELYARSIFGQIDYVIDEIAEGMPYQNIVKSKSKEEHNLAFEDWLKRREQAEMLGRQIKAQLFPELPLNAWYGVGKNRRADIAWQALEVLRHAMAWHDHPEGGITVNFDKPMQWTDEPLPRCRIEVDT